MIAELGGGNAASVLMERFIVPPASDTKPAARLIMRSVLTQSTPILDFAYAGDMLIVLEPDRVILYAKDGTAVGTLALTPATPLPRDPRGRLIIRDSTLSVYLPGTTCTGVWGQTGLSPMLKCRGDEAAWNEGTARVAWAARRNYLTMAGRQFYSVAAPPSAPVALVTLTGDLQIGGSTISGKTGSDIATLTTACVAPAALLVTSPDGDNETVRAIATTGAETRSLTTAVQLNGPVTALWTAENSAEASVVALNVDTHEYEASRLSVVCDR
jgi:hypothetical protein